MTHAKNALKMKNPEKLINVNSKKRIYIYFNENTQKIAVTNNIKQHLLFPYIPVRKPTRKHL